MNSKFKITLMRLALMRNSHDRGFALPIAMGVGLVIVLLGAVMMARSQTDRITSSTQKATNQGLSAAETGVARYQDLVNKYRAISTYNNTGTVSWANPSSIPNISSCGSTTEATAVSAQATTNWQNVDSSDSTKGQYRLISYAYTPNSGVAANTAPGTGTLIVEGRVNQTSSGNQDVGTATTQVEVTIPITKSTSSLSDTGLWASDFSFVGNNARANANVLDSSCSGVGTSFTTNPYLGNLPSATYGANVKGAYTKEVVSFPSLPGGNTYSAPSTGNINTISCSSNPMNLSGSSTTTLPRNNDKDSTGKLYGATGASAPASNATYTYVVPSCSGGTSIKLAGNARITVGRTGQETIKVYSGGDVDAAGNGGIGPYVNGTAVTKAIFYVNGSINLAGNGSAFSPTYFQFYKYGTTGDVKLNGNGSSSAFIFAPFVETQLVGNGTVSGVVWTKKISANGNASINQGKIDASALEVTPTSSSNGLGAINTWQRNQSN
jgi:Tfp pilus assembly protein PilX